MQGEARSRKAAAAAACGRSVRFASVCPFFSGPWVHFGEHLVSVLRGPCAIWQAHLLLRELFKFILTISRTFFARLLFDGLARF